MPATLGDVPPIPHYCDYDAVGIAERFIAQCCTGDGDIPIVAIGCASLMLVAEKTAFGCATCDDLERAGRCAGFDVEVDVFSPIRQTWRVEIFIKRWIVKKPFSLCQIV